MRLEVKEIAMHARQVVGIRGGCAFGVYGIRYLNFDRKCELECRIDPCAAVLAMQAAKTMQAEPGCWNWLWQAT